MFGDQAAQANSGTIPEVERSTQGRGLGEPRAPAQPFDRLEFYPEADPAWIRVILKGGEAYSFNWRSPIPDAAQLPGGSYRCKIQPDRWEITQNTTRYIFNWFNRLPTVVEQAAAVTRNEISGEMVRARSAGASVTGPSASPAGKIKFPVQPDPRAIERSSELRFFIWLLLEHFYDAPPIRNREVTRQEIEAFSASRLEVKEVLDRVTQAWAEMQRTSIATLQKFKPLAELIVEQFHFGNPTIIYNELMVRDEPAGLGLYHRASGLKYYDDHGLPSRDILDVYRRDVYYAARELPKFRYAPATQDWATLKLLQMFGVVDLEAVSIVQGLFTNLDLWIRLTKTSDWDKVLSKMWVQAGIILFFVGAEGIIVLLERLGTPREKLAAAIAHAALVITGRFFQIRFVYELKQALFDIGHHLYRVKSGPDGTVDPLSREHLNQAADIARPIMDEIIALGLAAGAFKVAAATAPLLNPPGGPGSVMFVPASAGAGAGRVPMPGAGAGAAAPGGVVAPPNVLVVMGAKDRPSSTKEPQEPPSGKELEEKLLGGDDRPDTPFYMSRRNRTLRTMLQDLLKHLNNPNNQKYYKPNGKPPIGADPEKVNIETGKFLMQPQYKKLLDKYFELYERVRRGLDRQTDYDTRRKLERQEKELDNFIKGNLGDKRPDKVEIFIDRRNFATTDVSSIWWDEFHNLKHAVYVEAIKAATGMEGAGLELESLRKSKLIESDTPSSATQTPPASKTPSSTESE